MYDKEMLDNFSRDYAQKCRVTDQISAELFDANGVLRGLRDKNGNGVVAGLTNISKIESFRMENGQKIPCDGNLWYRGYNVIDLVKGFEGKRYGFEEVTYLLLFGELPSPAQLKTFCEALANARHLPTNFTRDVIMKAPSADLMNSLTRSVLTLASYDDGISDSSLQTVLMQCMKLISEMPMLAVYGYHSYNHFLRDESLYIHRPQPELSTAENILLMLRPDKKYTALEAQVLDAALVLHMEHGGGNNSTFTTRVVTSAGSDTYSVIAAALSSLKGPKHGGANIKVMEMFRDLKANCRDWKDEDAIRAYLSGLLRGEGFDHTGLIYGMGHAVYSVSDPRAVILKGFVEQLSAEKGCHEEFELYATVERLAKEVITQNRKIYKGVCANVDFYSGFVYRMLGLPVDLYTPIFAIARIAGWSAHRLEELINCRKIIRPAYLSVAEPQPYVPMEER